MSARRRVSYFYDGASAVGGGRLLVAIALVSVLVPTVCVCVCVCAVCWSVPGGVRVVACGRAEEIGNFYYGQGHPMKPHRIRMAHNLVLNYGLYRQMEIYVRARASCRCAR